MAFTGIGIVVNWFNINRTQEIPIPKLRWKGRNKTDKTVVIWQKSDPRVITNFLI